jgi:polysaccharide biosynthesis protein PelF
VINEAGAAGLPVITTRDNGTEEQIADGETGLFVPYRDPAAVAAAIETLIADPGLRLRLGKNLRRKVACEYSVAALVPQWERLFDEL